MRTGIRLTAAVLTVSSFAALANAQQWEPAQVAVQAFSGQVEQDRIIVKLRNGVMAQVVGGDLRTANGNAFILEGPGGVPVAQLAFIASWARGHAVTDAELDRQRLLAERALRQALPDLKLQFEVRLVQGADLLAAIDTLRALPQVEYALPAPRAAAPPVPPDFRSDQGYLNNATTGIGAQTYQAWPGGTGANVRVCDVEYSWNTSHQDLPAVTHLGAPGIDPFGSTHHGTAVLGELASRNNGWGTIGAVYSASLYTAAANTAAGYNVASAITTAAAGLRAGDVILIEQQTFGPNGGNYVPCEWNRPVYDAIRQAVGAGVIVVEAAGNGGENLDGALYQTGNGGHWPFLLANDSGAIIVGAGAAPAAFGGSTTDRSRLGFSCYGATLDLQGWGERVTTCGYGNSYSSEGINLYYTAGFNGTSSASPIVASACAALQSVHKQLRNGQLLTPTQVRDFLSTTGSPQQAGAFPVSQRIGPRPNVPSAIGAAFGNHDCNSNGRPDAVDIALGASTDANHDGIPDECQCDADFNGDGFVNGVDYDLYVAAFQGGNASADFDGDGFITGLDFDLYVAAFEAGC